MQRLLKGFQAWRNRTTIRKQLSILVGLAVAISIALLIVFNYVTQAHANVQQQIEALTRVLTLENQRLDGYVEELSTFSLQLRSNSTFMGIAAQTTPLHYAQRQDVETALKTAYYSRSDLVEVELFLVRQQQRYAIEHIRRKVSLSEGIKVEELPDFASVYGKTGFQRYCPRQPRTAAVYTHHYRFPPRNAAGGAPFHGERERRNGDRSKPPDGAGADLCVWQKRGALFYRQRPER